MDIIVLNILFWGSIIGLGRLIETLYWTYMIEEANE